MRRRLAYAALVTLAVACTLDASRPCNAGDGCIGPSWTGSAATLATLVALMTVGLIVGRCLWRCRTALRWLGSLPSSVDPEQQVHGCRVTVVDAAAPFAFCAGIAQPRVFISRTLVERLAAGELEAVVLHEASHARRRDPLRRALRAAAAETLFFAPCVKWWAERAAVIDELTADRAALLDCAPGDLAGALLMTGSPSTALAPSFDGAAASRIAHLLGETAALPSAPAHVWRRSVAGLVPLLVVVGCLAASLVMSR